MRKRNRRLHDYNTMGKKVLCGTFAHKLLNNFAVGDQDNNLMVYNVQSVKPLTTLNSQVSNVSAVTAVTFTVSDEQIVVGSNRGSMNIWDLASQKISCCLKGHTIEISSFCVDQDSEAVLVSGSADTQVKVWDLRSKNCQHVLKNHSRKVSSLHISRGKILGTGGQDGLMFTSDLRMLRPVFEYEVDSGVLCLDSNSKGLVAVGLSGRIARIFQMNPPFSQIATTKNETMPITNCVFYREEFLVTAGTDNLKVYDLRGDICMTDNIETGSKGILDMVVGEQIQQIAFSSGTLTYHQCNLNQINWDGPYSNNSISYEPKRDRVEDAIQRNQSMKKNMSNYMVNHITNEKTKSMISKRSQSIARQMVGVNENINDALSNVKKISEELINRKNDLLQLRQCMGEEHNRFMKIINGRTMGITNILEMWVKGNVKQVMQTLKATDLYVASDVIGQLLKPSKMQISVQFALIIVMKARQMVQSKHLTLIKNGLQYFLQIVTVFKDEMIKLKTFGTDTGVDLAREERLRRYDMLIQQYVEVHHSHRLKRMIEKKDQASKLAEQLSLELNIIFKKVFGEQFNL